MKFGKSVGSATTTGAASAKKGVISGSRSLKEKDWTKEKSAAAKAGTAVKDGGVWTFGAIKRGVTAATDKIKGGSNKPTAY